MQRVIHIICHQNKIVLQTYLNFIKEYINLNLKSIIAILYYFLEVNLCTKFQIIVLNINYIILLQELLNQSKMSKICRKQFVNVLCFVL